MDPSGAGTIFWSEPGKTNIQSNGDNGRIGDLKIIAYGFVISEINGTFRTSTYIGQFSSSSKTSAENENKVIADINQKAMDWFTKNVINKESSANDVDDWPIVSSANSDWTYSDWGTEVNNHWQLRNLKKEKRPDKNYDYYILESTYLGMNPHYSTALNQNKLLYGDHIWSNSYNPELITVDPMAPHTGSTSTSVNIGTSSAGFSHTYSQAEIKQQVVANIGNKDVDWSWEPTTQAGKTNSIGFTPASTYRVQVHGSGYRQLAQIYLKGVFNTWKWGEQYMETYQYINGNY
jgi:hypothetical protein